MKLIPKIEYVQTLLTEEELKLLIKKTGVKSKKDAVRVAVEYFLKAVGEGLPDGYYWNTQEWEAKFWDEFFEKLRTMQETEINRLLNQMADVLAERGLKLYMECDG